MRKIFINRTKSNNFYFGLVSDNHLLELKIYSDFICTIIIIIVIILFIYIINTIIIFL